MKLQSNIDNVPQALEQYGYEEGPGPNFGPIMSVPGKHNGDFSRQQDWRLQNTMGFPGARLVPAIVQQEPQSCGTKSPSHVIV
jgi:hypothetical protein